MTKKTAVIAVGGNSLITDKNHQTVDDQRRQAANSMHHITSMIQKGYEVIITHGNGPQVGFILMRSEFARERLHTVPLDTCGADTQGAIGYNFQMALGNEFRHHNINKQAATIVTQVLVDRNDPAFKSPSKPIGPFYTEQEAKKYQETNNWSMIEDSGRGWRRVVPSPKPLEIIEIDVIKKMIQAGIVTIAVGGGGIPVIKKENGEIRGIAAVIDKDLASSLLATQIKADLFIISTDVEKVCLNFGTKNQTQLDCITVTQAKQYIKEGQFAKGSMLPKIQSAVQFLENGGKEALITNFENLENALDGKSGTRIIKG